MHGFCLAVTLIATNQRQFLLIEVGESLEEGGVREIFEETGIDILIQ